jgi:hypothetical protein
MAFFVSKVAFCVARVTGEVEGKRGGGGVKAIIE